MGKIYDLDAPGVPAFASSTAGFTLRYRVNFKFWAVLVLDFGAFLVPVRCSEKKAWYSRQSYKRTGTMEAGTVTGFTANTLTGAGPWGGDIWKDGAVYIHAGTGSKQFRRITGNTATVITVSPDWGPGLGLDSKYALISSTSWTKLDDVTGDNKNDDGVTNITWNLA